MSRVDTHVHTALACCPAAVLQAVVQAWETSPEPTAAAGAGVLVEQLEAAVAEVQHFGEVAGSTSGSSSETVAESGIQGPEAAAGR